eukprot:3823119-Rhodomonas_salina.1
MYQTGSTHTAREIKARWQQTGQTTSASGAIALAAAEGDQPYARGQAFGLVHLHLFGDLRAHAAPS